MTLRNCDLEFFRGWDRKLLAQPLLNFMLSYFLMSSWPLIFSDFGANLANFGSIWKPKWLQNWNKNRSKNPSIFWLIFVLIFLSFFDHFGTILAPKIDQKLIKNRSSIKNQKLSNLMTPPAFFNDFCFPKPWKFINKSIQKSIKKLINFCFDF